MSLRLRDAPELGGRDPLDEELAPGPPPVVPARLAQLLRTKASLGLAPVAAPAVLFVPLGMALGPLWLNILTPTVVSHLDPVVSTALAVLGVFVGFALDWRDPDTRRFLLPASLQSSVTLVVVGGAMGWLLLNWQLALGVSVGLTALVFGTCASVSAASAVEGSLDSRFRAVARVADLDDVVPIVVGGMILASLHSGGLGLTLALTLETCLVGVGVGFAGWLLFERADGPAEGTVFVLGALVLVGGAAAYLSLSPLLAGLSAGLLWHHAPTKADDIVRSNVARFQHPLVAILLLIGGATVTLDRVTLWLFAPYVLFRLCGKLVGGWAAARHVPAVAAADLGAFLIPPGLLGIAFALHVGQASGLADFAPVVAAVALGTLASELLAAVVLPTEDRS